MFGAALSTANVEKTEMRLKTRIEGRMPRRQKKGTIFMPLIAYKDSQYPCKGNFVRHVCV